MQDGLAGTADQYLRPQYTGRDLESSGPAEGPSVLPRGGRATACYLGFQRGPAREAVLASQCQLRCRERYSRLDRTKPADGVRLTVGSGAEQLSRLTAKLVKIRSVRKPGHNVSSAPGLAFRRDKKTILPGKARCHADHGGGLSPSREPGGILQRRAARLPDAAVGRVHN